MKCAPTWANIEGECGIVTFCMDFAIKSKVTSEFRKLCYKIEVCNYNHERTTSLK